MLDQGSLVTVLCAIRKTIHLAHASHADKVLPKLRTVPDTIVVKTTIVYTIYTHSRKDFRIGTSFFLKYNDCYRQHNNKERYVTLSLTGNYC